MKCLNQNCDALEIEKDDNFCYKCGHWTAQGYTFIKNKENINNIMNGDAVKKDDNFSVMFGITAITFIVFFLMCIFRGNDLFKPLFYLKRQVDSYLYGYSTSIIKTENIYNKINITEIDEAKEFIRKDLNTQRWKCGYEVETFKYQNDVEINNSIPVVSFCDISSKEAQKITNVVDRMYFLFPKMKGALTDISITNAKTKQEYIARFQPMFQFVNPNEDIKNYNKVNKTQILLNSYYFLNDKTINTPIDSVIEEGWYVKDASWESVVAHELGHYISFVILLRENGLEDIILVTNENEGKINDVLNKFESGELSMTIINQALENFNNKYNMNLDIDSFAQTISKYASVKKNGKLIADETIAEAIHDYYLHGDNCSRSSYEIVNIIKLRLDGAI